jgi:hypothetical protein
LPNFFLVALGVLLLYLGGELLVRNATRLAAPAGMAMVSIVDVFNPQRVVVGTVTDASTGKPIESFVAMPVIVFRPDFYSTRTTDAAVGRDGRYELRLTGSADPNSHYRVRFEAEGYRSVVSEASFGPRDGRAMLDFALQPAPARGRARGPAGPPRPGPPARAWGGR